MASIPDNPTPADWAVIRVADVADQVARGEADPGQIEACIDYYARATNSPAEEIRTAFQRIT